MAATVRPPVVRDEVSDYLASHAADPVFVRKSWRDSVSIARFDFAFRACGLSNVSFAEFPFTSTAFNISLVPIPDAVIVVNVTRVDDKFQTSGNVTIEGCDRAQGIKSAPATAPATMPKVGDLLLIESQCVKITARLGHADGNCNETHAVFDATLIGDFCRKAPTASVCKTPYNKDATTRPEHLLGPSDDVAWTKAPAGSQSEATTTTAPLVTTTPKASASAPASAPGSNTSSASDTSTRRVSWMAAAVGVALATVTAAVV